MAYMAFVAMAFGVVELALCHRFGDNDDLKQLTINDVNIDLFEGSTSATKATLALTPIEDENAKCNDGTKAAYYFRGATDKSLQNTWVLLLQGGGWCTTTDASSTATAHADETSCVVRRETSARLTTAPTRETLSLAGIFDNDAAKSPVGGANIAFLWYCSSDAHMGNKSVEVDGKEMHFKGWDIVRAAARQLAKGSHMGHNSTFILGGLSAGAWGAMVHLDSIHEVLPTGVKVLGLLDGPASFGHLPWMVKMTKEAAELYASDGAMTCDGGGNNTWKCLFSEHRLPMLKTPFLLILSQADAYSLWGYCSPKSAKPEFKELSGRITKLIGNLSSHVAVLSSTCWDHAISVFDSFADQKVGDLLRKFLKNPAKAPKQISEKGELNADDSCASVPLRFGQCWDCSFKASRAAGQEGLAPVGVYDEANDEKNCEGVDDA